MNEPCHSPSTAPYPSRAPLPIANPPGLDRLRYRIGDRASWLAALAARIGDGTFPHLRARFRSRDPSDASLALFDAWSTAADVLTFYTERIANEGYLRTATERRSLVELARLIGYRPAPGVAARAFLSFQLEAGAETTIPAGTAVRSIPSGDGELPQTFETSAPLSARAEWNALRPRQTRPQQITIANVTELETLYVQGTRTTVKPNDRLLFVFEDDRRVIRRVRSTQVDQERQATIIRLSPSRLSARELVRALKNAASAFHDALELEPPGDEGTLGHWRKSLALLQEKLRSERGLIELDADAHAWAADLHGQYTEIKKALIGGETPAVLSSPNLALSGTMATALDSAARAVDQFVAEQRSVERIAERLRTAFLDGWSDDEPPIGKTRVRSSLQATVRATAQRVRAIHDHLTAGPAKESAARLLDGLLDLDADPPSAARALRERFVTIWIEFSFADLEEQANRLLPPLPAIFKGGELVDVAGLLHRALAQPPDPPAAGDDDGWLLRLASEPEIQIDLQEHFGEEVLPGNVTANASGVSQRLAGVLGAFNGLHDSLRSLLKTVEDAYQGALAALRRQRYDFQHEFLQARDRFDDPNHWASVLEPIELEHAMNIWEQLSGYAGRLQDVTVPPPLWTFDELRDQQRLRTLVEGGSVESPTLLHLLKELSSIPPRQSVVGDRQTVLVAQLEALLERLGPQPPDKAPSGPPPAMGLNRVLAAIDRAAVAGRIGRDVRREIGDALAAAAESGSQLTPDAMLQLLRSRKQGYRQAFAAIWSSIRAEASHPRVIAFSKSMPLFGHNAPKPVLKSVMRQGDPPSTTPEAITTSTTTQIAPSEDDWPEGPMASATDLFTSQAYPQLVGGDFVIVAQSSDDPSSPIKEREHKVRAIETPFLRSDYGLTAETTRIQLEPTEPWRSPPGSSSLIEPLRKTLLLLPAEELSLADEPIEEPIGPAPGDAQTDGDVIELDGLYLDLEAGRLAAIEGEPLDSPGVVVAEMNRIQYVRHVLRDRSGDAVHTLIYLADPLQYVYRRDTMQIGANVALATHGETVRQVLGSGDARQAFQRFALGKQPLTYLAAQTPSGVVGTVAIRVNELPWRETESLVDSAPNDRSFAVRIDDQHAAEIRFGDGRHGARLPTGADNVRAAYRVGLGQVGNIAAGKINQLASRPAGVREVRNLLPSAGGAEAENLDDIRRNAPLALLALDRLVSVSDYADFARNYAAIDKAQACLLLAGGRRTVHVTVAGAGDAPIAGAGIDDQLVEAFRRYGDPLQAVHVAPRDLLTLFLSAHVKVAAESTWPLVEPRVRTALYEALGFHRRHLGQNVYLSEVLRVIQGVSGVEYVDIDFFGALSESDVRSAIASGAGGAYSVVGPFQKLLASEITDAVRVRGARVEAGKIQPAQLACLRADVPDSLFLREITP